MKRIIDISKGLRHAYVELDLLDLKEILAKAFKREGLLEEDEYLAFNSSVTISNFNFSMDIRRDIVESPK